MKEILVTAINYACENETYNYAKQFENFTNKDKIVLYIVDNKTSEGSNLQERLNEINCDIVYLKPNENLGYLNGCFFGVDKFLEINGYIANWVVVSNTDITYDNNMFYERFLNCHYEDSIWCVGPSVYDTSGIYSNPHYKERISLKHVNRIIKCFSNKYLAKSYLFLSKIKSKLGYKNSIKEESQYVYSNHGCFFILKKEFFEHLGKEKFGALLYSEESFIAEFILENNKKAFYDNRIEVIHNANLVTGKVNIKRKAKFISESMSYIKRRFYE